jgi:ABC-type glycerol-3-phosphate transport system substrate-binding protein
MKISKQTILGLILILLISTITFSACRKPAKDNTSYEGVELTYYKMFDDKEIFEPIIAEFESNHPGLKIHYRKFSDFKDYQNTILNEMAEGRGPDIFSMQNTWFQSNHKKLNPMPKSMVPEETSPEEVFASMFVDVAYKDLVREDDENIKQVYGLPMTVDTLALYYNRSHFEDRIPAKGRPSTTWEGIKEDVFLLNKIDPDFGNLEVGGIAMGLSENISRAIDILFLLFLQNNLEFYNENLSQAIFARNQGGTTSYPGPEALDLFMSFSDESQRHYSWNNFLTDINSGENELDAFARGRVSMLIGYSFTHDDIVNKINVLRSRGATTINPSDIRIATIPQMFNPEVSTQKRVTYANYFAETVSRNSEHPDLAWKFLVELTSKNNLEYYFEKTKKPTSRRDMIEEQQRDPIYGIFASQIGFAESFPIINYYEYKDIFENVITETAKIRTTARANLSNAQDLITKMLPEAGIK